MNDKFLYAVTAQPICLLPKEIYIRAGSNAVLIGWGSLSNQKGIKKKAQESNNCLNIVNFFQIRRMCNKN